MRSKKIEDASSVQEDLATHHSVSPQKNMKTYKKKIIVLVLLLALLAGLGYAFFMKTPYGTTLKLAWQLQKEQQLVEEDKKALAQLSKIMLLPEVTPTMARITDIAALQKEQPEFFANAKNGDRVIIYPDFVIIFDTQENKIIKIGPVKSPAPTASSTPTQGKK